MTYVPTARCGCNVSRIDSNGIAISIADYPRSTVIERHAHERDYLCVPVRGAFEEHAGDGPIQCGAGQVILKPAGEPHQDSFPVHCTAINIEIDDWRRNELFDAGLVVNEVRSLESPEFLPLGRQLAAELRGQDPYSVLAAQSLAITLLAISSRRSRRPATLEPARIRKVKSILRDAFPRIPGLGELAREVGIDASTLARSFRAATGRTVGSYARQLRIDEARRRLAEGDDGLTKIALDLGYSDQSHFTRAFRSAVGCAPGAFARRHRSTHDDH